MASIWLAALEATRVVSRNLNGLTRRSDVSPPSGPCIRSPAFLLSGSFTAKRPAAQSAAVCFRHEVADARDARLIEQEWRMAFACDCPGLAAHMPLRHFGQRLRREQIRVGAADNEERLAGESLELRPERRQGLVEI